MNSFELILPRGHATWNMATWTRHVELIIPRGFWVLVHVYSSGLCFGLPISVWGWKFLVDEAGMQQIENKTEKQTETRGQKINLESH